MYDLLHRLIQRTLSLTPSQSSISTSSFRRVSISACRFFQSCSFLLASSPSSAFSSFQQYYVPVLLFIFRTLADPDCSLTAAKAFHPLLIHGFKQPITVQQYPNLLRDLTQEASVLVVTLTHSSSALYSSSTASEACLLLLECVTRTIVQMFLATKDEPQLSYHLQLLTSPLLQALQTRIDTTLPAVTSSSYSKEYDQSLLVISRLLDGCAQIIRFCDVLTGTGALLPLLTQLWPLLQQIESSPLINRSSSSFSSSSLCTPEVVTGSLFCLYECAIQSAFPLLTPHIEGITTSIVTVLSSLATTSSSSSDSSSLSYSSGQSQALRCASTIVEVLSQQDSQEVIPFVSGLIDRVTQSIYVMLNSNCYEADTLEKYFAFMYSCQLHAAQALSVSAASLQMLPRLCLVCLRTSKERNLLRNVLQVMQACYCPISSRVQPYHSALVSAALIQGLETLKVLLECLAGGVLSALRPNLIETIYLLLTSLNEDSRHSAGVMDQWVTAAINGLEGTPLQPVTMSPESRASVATALPKLIRSGNSRMFKALMQDFAKVCASEMSDDCLLSYFE